VKPRGVVLHTVGVKGDSSVEGIRDFHVRVNGWRDIGYHFVVTKDGTVHTGRPLTQAGAHTQGANDTVGVCVTGDGDREPWTQAQWRGVLGLLVRLGYAPAAVCGHREAQRVFSAAPTSKTCPGRLVDLDEVRAELARALAVKDR
jgi:N-acetylmuramoyl-L-alanine amidase